MNSKLTDVTIILDKSGSMAAVQSDTIGGFNTFLADQQAAQGDCNLSLILFDTSYTVHTAGKPIKQVEPLTPSTYQPGGYTALLDAVGKAINEAGGRFSGMPEEDRPGKVIFVILTDGQENASLEFTKDKIKDMIEAQINRWNWEFLYIGANQDAFDEAGSIGICAEGTMSFVSSGAATRSVMESVSAGLMMARDSGQRMSWSEADRRAAHAAGRRLHA